MWFYKRGKHGSYLDVAIATIFVSVTRENLLRKYSVSVSRPPRSYVPTYLNVYLDIEIKF